MIETKEQYETMNRQLAGEYIVGDYSLQDIIETIDALREVARGARTVAVLMERSTEIGLGTSQALSHLSESLDALADWIVEE